MSDFNSIVADSMHELRYFNQRLKSLAEQISKDVKVDELGQGTSINVNATHSDQIRTVAEGILSLSQLFTTRISLIDLELNPSVITSFPISTFSMFGKFEKARRMLNSQSRGKKVKIKITNSEKQIPNVDAYPIIDILPYLILDNAIKYSPNDTEVNVEFISYSKSFEIVVESMGPCVEDDELSKITDKGFRSKNATLTPAVGSGIGLHLVKYICDLHNIKLCFQSGKKIFDCKDVPHSQFIVKLTFDIY